MTDIQCTIDTLDRNLLTDFRTYLARVGVAPTVDYTVHNGVQFYCIHANNNNSYVCTKAQWHFLSTQLHCTNIVQNPHAFRVYPTIQITGHKNKWAFATVQYTSLAKAHTTPLLNLAVLPIQ